MRSRTDCPPESDEVASERYRQFLERVQAAVEAQPAECPECHRDEVIPCFPGPEFECVQCGNIWSPDDGR